MKEETLSLLNYAIYDEGDSFTEAEDIELTDEYITHLHYDALEGSATNHHR